MPELPEIQAHAARLHEAFAGATLESFRPLSFTALKTVEPDPSVLEGQTLERVSSRGKLLGLVFPDATFAVHLMNGGRLRPDADRARKPRGGLARWSFDDGSALLLTEAGKERSAGVWLATSLDEADPCRGWGPDADQVGVGQLGEILAAAKGARIHGVLRTQSRIAGIGRRLANEICWTARCSPFATASSFTGDALEELHAAVTDVLAAALDDERTRDEMVRSRDRRSQVHHRVGEPCPRCGDQIRAVSYQRYEIDYCATCQTDGRVLADNTTSKFLK